MQTVWSGMPGAAATQQMPKPSTARGPKSVGPDANVKDVSMEGPVGAEPEERAIEAAFHIPPRPEKMRGVLRPAKKARVCRACLLGHYLGCEDERCVSMRLEDRHE